MATREVLALNTTTPQILAPQAGDTYSMPRAVGVTGDVTVTAGNIIPATAGKGIDFSANTNAAGMTSELLTWYEEGTWTPTYLPETNSFTSITYNAATGGFYTRVGRLVICHCRIATDALTVGSATGALYLDGLPFSSVNYPSFRAPSGSIGQSTNFGVNNPSAIWQVPNSTKALMTYKATAPGASVTLAVSDLSTAASGKNDLFATIIYLAA